MVSVVVDLRSAFGPARDQGRRPTCLAFATSDTHAGLRSDWTPLSCEYAFYRAQKRAGRPSSSGALLQPMLDALRLDGQPSEQAWPYLASIPNEQLWKPPAGIGPMYARNGSNGGKDVDAVIGALDRGIPAIILMMLSASFFLPGAEGIIDLKPGETPEPSQRHAVVAVGHGQIGSSRAILIRNSWGQSWGSSGHGWLTETYLAPRIFGSALLLEDVSVSSGSHSA